MIFRSSCLCHVLSYFLIITSCWLDVGLGWFISLIRNVLFTLCIHMQIYKLVIKHTSVGFLYSNIMVLCAQHIYFVTNLRNALLHFVVLEILSSSEST